MSSEKLSFKLKDLEEPVAELKRRRDDYRKRGAATRAAEHNRKLADLIFPLRPPDFKRLSPQSNMSIWGEVSALK